MGAEQLERSDAAPLVSVVVEGYNEMRAFGTADATLAALARQEFPLDRVEVVLVGAAEQLRQWAARAADPRPFARIELVDAAGAHYLEMKNLGARRAGGAIVAFTDSDVEPRPRWLASIAEAIGRGADVSAGPSLFQGAVGRGARAAARLVASSITWGWIVGRHRNGTPRAAGFMDHNAAFRADALRNHPYRTDLGRLCGAPLLYRALADAGARIALTPGQQALHAFSWRAWLVSLHFRYGYEVYVLRREDRSYPNQWIARTGPLEPLVTMAWHVLLDVPRWLRFSRCVGVASGRRLRLLPLLFALSIVARGSEMAAWTGRCSRRRRCAAGPSRSSW
jgi:glycosyltransferase involved in cell wall biosynthesis